MMTVSARSWKRFDYADMLAQQLRALDVSPAPVREYRPFANRRYRLDLAWPDRHLFVECDGGEYLGNVPRRHGNVGDCRRWNLLTRAGWRGYRFTGSQVRTAEACDWIAQEFRR